MSNNICRPLECVGQRVQELSNVISRSEQPVKNMVTLFTVQLRLARHTNCAAQIISNSCTPPTSAS